MVLMVVAVDIFGELEQGGVSGRSLKAVKCVIGGYVHDFFLCMEKCDVEQLS